MIILVAPVVSRWKQRSQINFEFNIFYQSWISLPLLWNIGFACIRAYFVMIRLPAQTGCDFFSRETDNWYTLYEKIDRDPEEDISTLVEVYKEGLDVTLGNELEELADILIAFKDEQPK